MKRNKYDKYASECRKLETQLFGPRGKSYIHKVPLVKPYWTGDYQIYWVPNYINVRHPDFDTVWSLRKYLPNTIIPGRVYKWTGHNTVREVVDPTTYTVEKLLRTAIPNAITESEWNALEPEQRKYFVPRRTFKFSGDQIIRIHCTNNKGEKLYELRLNTKYWFIPKLKKYKITSVYSNRRDEPEYVKLLQRYYRLAPHYYWNDISRGEQRVRVNERKLGRQIQDQIREGFEDYYYEKEGL